MKVTTITDPTLLAQLATADGRIVSREPSGGPVKSPVSDEEFEEAREEPSRGITLAEFWKKVKRGMKMPHAVDWTPRALRELTAVRVDAADQNAVTVASHRLERALATDPLRVGVPRNSSVDRTAVDPPLGIDDEVIEDDKTVRV